MENQNIIKAFLENDINDPVFKDAETFELLQSGKTDNIPGYENEQTKYLLNIFKPDVFEDLVIIACIDVPGIITFKFDFVGWIVQNKFHPEIIHYIHPVLEKHLKSTYGFLLYQEQSIAIIQEISNLIFKDAENARKAIGKKNNKQIEFYFDLFHKGCLSNSSFISGCKTINKETDEVIKELWIFFETNIDSVPSLKKRSVLIQSVLRSYKIAYLTAHKIL